MRTKALGCLIAMGGLLCWMAGGRVFAQTSSYEACYQKARTAYYNFKQNKEKQKYRHNWQKVAKKFEEVVNKYPDSARAPDALFTAGRLYHDLYVISRVSDDLDTSIRLFRKLVQRFPNNHLADDAQLYIALKWVEFSKNPNLAREELSLLIKKFPSGDVTPKARRMLEDLGGDLVAKPQTVQAKPKSPKESSPIQKPSKPVLEKIRHWSNSDYTRIALYTRTKSKYRSGKLPADPKHQLPHRLYVDLVDAKLDSDLTKPVALRDSVVRRIRLAERQGGFVRVVVEMDGDRSHRVFPMDDPARVVLDVTAGEDALGEVIGTKTDKTEIKSPRKKPPSAQRKVQAIKKKSKPGASLSMLAGLKVKRLVLDPGHGGQDTGAIGPSGLLEKDITLDLAKRVKKLLSDKLKLDVLMTRKKDRFLELEERTAIANKYNADLFVSIHFNAHHNRKYHGVETFYLDLTDDRYSIKLAARENATSERSISDLDKILADLALKSHVDDSIALSRYLQRGMVGRLRRKYKKVKDLGLKPALFYVLIGARMPSVLVEASFISNPMEEKRLRSPTYRQQLAWGIYHGIKNFIHERNRMLGM